MLKFDSIRNSFSRGQSLKRMTHSSPYHRQHGPSALCEARHEVMPAIPIPRWHLQEHIPALAFQDQPRTTFVLKLLEEVYQHIELLNLGQRDGQR
jgi:hypothetical protein